MTVTEKRRILRKDVLSSYKDLYYPPIEAIVGGPYVTSYDVYSQQFTRSEGHNWPQAKGVRDNGGPFDSIKLEYINKQIDDKVVFTRVGSPFVEHNRHTPVPAGGGIPAPFMATDGSFEYYAQWVGSGSYGADLAPIGTEFIAQTVPTSPVVDGAVNLAELYREGLPNLVGAGLKLRDTTSFFRSLGGEYLNYQFGWLPLVSGIKDAAKAITESHEILAQLAKDSGKNVHRRRHSQPIRTTTVTDDSYNYPFGCDASGLASPPWYRVTDSTTIERSFSGCYTFHFEPARMSNIERIATEARLLYGLELTPEVLWNLAPWSWLIDWVANVGPLLSNVSAFQEDGLVLRYGYVMEKTTRRVTRINQVTPGVGTTWPSVFQDEFVGTRKRREKATPYGFGLTTEAFTNRQWSILAALGMSRLPRSL
jgi:hypothetical protein